MANRRTLTLELAVRAARISQAELAREIGCSRQWMSAVVRGTSRPSPDFVRDVATVLADRLQLDPHELRDALFPDGIAIRPRSPSALGRRLAVVG